jgi:hypothetical protein
MLVLGVYNMYNLNSLGRDGWRQYRSGGLSGLSDHRLMENIALGQFQQELDALRAQVGPNDRIIGGDGRVGFFFPRRVYYSYPPSCSTLGGYRAFVLLLGDDSIEQARVAGAPASVDEWSACRSPKLSLVAQVPGNFAVFTIGSPSPEGAAASCALPPAPGGLAAVFGTAPTEHGAEAIVNRVSKLGFVQAHVVRTGCAEYTVLESDVPNEAVGRGIVAEARSVSLHVEIRRLPQAGGANTTNGPTG